MNVGQLEWLSLMGPCKLHAARSIDVLYTKMYSDGFNGSEHPMRLIEFGTSSTALVTVPRTSLYRQITASVS